jgi:hypothetical protein
VLGHHALEPALAALGQQTLAIIECLRMQEACDCGPADQMTKSPLAVLKVDGAQVVAVELHEVEGPEYEVGLGPFVHLPMELLEAVGVHELSINDG